MPTQTKKPEIDKYGMMGWDARLVVWATEEYKDRILAHKKEILAALSEYMGGDVDHPSNDIREDEIPADCFDDPEIGNLPMYNLDISVCGVEQPIPYEVVESIIRDIVGE